MDNTQQNIQNVTLTPRSLVTVTGRILGNDAPNGLYLANVKLSGYETYDQNLTNEQGYFTINNVFADQIYQIEISKPYYQTYMSSVAVGNTNTDIPAITLSEVPSPPVNVVATLGGNTVTLTWDSPNHSNNPDSLNNRSLVGYKLSRFLAGNLNNPSVWEFLGNATTLDSMYSETFPGSVQAVFQYAVQANYSGNVLSVPAFSNEVAVHMTANVTINLTTADNLPTQGALIKLSHLDGNPVHVYYMTANSGSVVIPDVWIGLYTIEARLPGYNHFIANNVEIYQSLFDLSIQFQLSNYAYEDDFEIYESFSMVFNPWTLIDEDGLNTCTVQGFDFPNCGLPMSFMIFSPSQTNPPLETSPHSGLKMAVCFSVIPNPTETQNNDWMISPKISLLEEGILRFYTRSYSDESNFGKFRVMIGSSPDPNQMTQINPGSFVEAPIDWTMLTYSLSDYNNQNVYLGINCISNNSTTLFLDDIQIERGSENLQNPLWVNTLKSIYPNPFNPDTKISFDLASKETVIIEVFNVKGQKIKTLLNTQLGKGEHTIIWNGKDEQNRKLTSGVYFCKMTTGSFSSTKKMILLK